METSAKIFLEAYFKTQNKNLVNPLRYGFPIWHLRMLTDTKRLEFYQSILKDRVKDKVVVDIGAGTGMLTWLALSAGAKKVYAVEKNEFFQEILKNLMEPQLKSGEVKLITKDAATLTIKDLPDVEVVLHEIFGANGISEGVIEVFEAMEKNGLLTGKTLLPSKFQIMVEPVTISGSEVGCELGDFAGFPLSRLSSFMEYREINLEYASYKSLAPVKSAQSKVLFQSEIRKNLIETDLVVSWDDSVTGCTHLRMWLEMEVENILYSSDFEKGSSHWANILYTIPKNTFKKAHFEIKGRSILLKSVSN